MLVARCHCVQCGAFNPQLEMEESKPETEESEIEVDLDFNSNCKLDDR